MKTILSYTIITMLQVSIAISVYWELKNGIRTPTWVFLPRIVSVTAALLVFLMPGDDNE